MMGGKVIRRKQRHQKEPLRFTSDGNADRKRRGYGVFQRFAPFLRFGVTGAPVSDFGVKNRVNEMKKSRNKGISGNKIRWYSLVSHRERRILWTQRTSKESVCIWTKKQ